MNDQKCQEIEVAIPELRCPIKKHHSELVFFFFEGGGEAGWEGVFPGNLEVFLSS